MPPFIAAIVLGLAAGIRAFVAPAAICWAAFAGRRPLEGTHFAFMASIITAIAFTILFILELFTEKLPSSAGTQFFGPKMILRLLMGGFAGAVLGSSNQSDALFLCAAIGAISGIAGSFGELSLREFLVKRTGGRAAMIILDGLAIVLSLVVFLPIH